MATTPWDTPMSSLPMSCGAGHVLGYKWWGTGERIGGPPLMLLLLHCVYRCAGMTVHVHHNTHVYNMLCILHHALKDRDSTYGTPRSATYRNNPWTVALATFMTIPTKTKITTILWKEDECTHSQHKHIQTCRNNYVHAHTHTYFHALTYAQQNIKTYAQYLIILSQVLIASHIYIHVCFELRLMPGKMMQ